jgi:hypothetical protein
MAMNLRHGWLVVGFAALFCQKVQAQQIQGVDLASTNETIPFQLRNKFLILVEGWSGAIGPLKFILDTGVTHTMVDVRVAGNRPPARQKGKVLNFDKNVPVDWTELPEIEIGPLRLQHVPVMVGDLKGYSEFAAGVDGVIGLDLLRATQGLRIDFRRNLITFKISGSGRSVNSADAPAIIVRVTIQGEPVPVILDTGIQGMLLYSDRMRKHHAALMLDGKNKNGHEGRLAGEQILLQEVRFGPDKLQASAFLIPAAPHSLPADIDGYVGPSILGAQMIELDFAANAIRWQ